MDKPIICYVIGKNPEALNVLSGFISRSSELVLIGSCSGVAGFLDGAGEVRADISFVDLDGEGVVEGLFGDGLEVFGEVVCLGSSRDLALDAFDLGAVDFLLKPMNEGRFLRAMDKVKRNLDVALPVCVEQVLPYFFIQCDTKGKLIRIVKDDIVYVESALNYLHIHMDRASHSTYLTIREMEDKLHMLQFIRVHKSFMINLEKVVSVEGNRICLVNNVEVALGPSYREVFFERLGTMLVRSKRLG